MPINQTVIIRTHVYNSDVQSLLDRFAAETDFNVLVVADETSAPLNAPTHIPKIGFDKDLLNQMGLAVPTRVGWLCGDYFFYVARTNRPTDEYFWIIEPDCVINSADLGAFFSPFSNITDDLLAIGLSPRTNIWSWYAVMHEYVPHVYGCLFPLLRLSGRAVDYLYEKRKQISADFARSGRSVDFMPNDEAHVASLLFNSPAFKCRNINDILGGIGGGLNFTDVMPFSRKFLSEGKPDGYVYHSVRSGEDFRQRYEHFLSLIQNSNQLNRAVAALPHVEAELGSEALTHYSRRLEEQRKVVEFFAPPAENRVSAINGVIVITADKTPVYFFINNGFDYIQRQHKLGLFYERGDLLYLYNFIKPDSVFVDIGAHTGNHSLFIGLYVELKRIICFEPNDQARAGLDINIRLNGLQNITDLSTAHYALGERDYEAFIAYTADNWGNGCITDNKSLRAFSNAVQVRRGDDLLRGEQVDFMKIDVASPVLPVLKGLARTLAGTRCGLYVTAKAAERADVVAFLEAKNYKIIRETIAYQRDHRLIAIQC